MIGIIFTFLHDSQFIFELNFAKTQSRKPEREFFLFCIRRCSCGKVCEGVMLVVSETFMHIRCALAQWVNKVNIYKRERIRLVAVATDVTWWKRYDRKRSCKISEIMSKCECEYAWSSSSSSSHVDERIIQVVFCSPAKSFDFIFCHLLSSPFRATEKKRPKSG